MRSRRVGRTLGLVGVGRGVVQDGVHHVGLRDAQGPRGAVVAREDLQTAHTSH
jgi:hypothetical protein